MVKIKLKEKTIVVYSEYNSELPRRARQLGGKWVSDIKAWRFDIRDKVDIRKLYMDIYGEFEYCGDRVIVRIPVTEKISELRGSVYMCGRQIARAWGRDSGAQTGKGVSLVGCSASSGGSVKNWETVITPIPGKEAYIKIKDVPRSLAEKEGVEIVGTNIDANALQKEKEKMLKRIAEIDKLISAG
jgi:hypothetical protein